MIPVMIAESPEIQNTTPMVAVGQLGIEDAERRADRAEQDRRSPDDGDQLPSR